MPFSENTTFEEKIPVMVFVWNPETSSATSKEKLKPAGEVNCPWAERM